MAEQANSKQAVKNILVLVLILVAIYFTWTKFKSTEDSNKIAETTIIEEKKEVDPYEMMHIVFEGMPKEEEIKKYLEAFLKKNQIPITKENVVSVGDKLLYLRKQSVVGVTEMDIIKHAYQNGVPNMTINEQLAFTASLLEKIK